VKSHHKSLKTHDLTIAIHEAGHVAGHLSQRLHVRRVTLDPGYCDHGEIRPDSLTTDELFKHATACLCGPEAVRHFCPGVDDGGGRDERDALMLATFTTGDPTPWITLARDPARVLVTEHTAAITAIAAALLDRDALEYRQLRNLWFQLQYPAAALLADREHRALRSRRGAHWRGY
jgi:hypothetical protein